MADFVRLDRVHWAGVSRGCVYANPDLVCEIYDASPDGSSHLKWANGNITHVVGAPAEVAKKLRDAGFLDAQSAALPKKIAAYDPWTGK